MECRAWGNEGELGVAIKLEVPPEESRLEDRSGPHLPIDGALWGWLGSRAMSWRGPLECLTLGYGLRLEWGQEEILV